MGDVRKCGLCEGTLYLIRNTVTQETVPGTSACQHCDMVCSPSDDCDLCAKARGKKYPELT